MASARVMQQATAMRPAASRAVPEGGDASVGLTFESDAERRAMVPELDHGHLKAARDEWARRALHSRVRRSSDL